MPQARRQHAQRLKEWDSANAHWMRQQQGCHVPKSYDGVRISHFPPTMEDWSDCLAVHMIQVRDMGLIQGQNWDLEGLSEACGVCCAPSTW